MVHNKLHYYNTYIILRCFARWTRFLVATVARTGRLQDRFFGRIVHYSLIATLPFLNCLFSVSIPFFICHLVACTESRRPSFLLPLCAPLSLSCFLVLYKLTRVTKRIIASAPSRDNPMVALFKQVYNESPFVLITEEPKFFQADTK